MNAVLAIDPGFSEVRVGVLNGNGGAGVTLRSLHAGDDPFQWFVEVYGKAPAAVAIAGGSYAPCPPGVYAVDARMAEDAAEIDGWHPRNQMTVRAFEYCSGAGVPCVALHPMSSASIAPEARLSGYPGYERRGVYYALPQLQAFRKAALALGLDPVKAPIVTAYLGDESSVAAHLGERVLDTSLPAACEGPFGFTSAGTVPATGFISWLKSEGRPRLETIREMKWRSGAFSYSGASSLDEFSRLLDEGGKGAASAVSAMAYQVSKEIGRQMAALKGEARAVALTGPGASLRPLVSAIEQRISKWCPVVCFREDLSIPALIAEGSKILVGEKRS